MSDETPLEGLERVAKTMAEPDISVGEDGTIRTSYAVSPRELARALMRDEAANGTQWYKCANCGDPYVLREGWSDTTVCDQECWDAYLAYINNPDGL